MLPSGTGGGSVPKPDVDKMLGIVADRIKLQQNVISGYGAMHDAMGVASQYAALFLDHLAQASITTEAEETLGKLRDSLTDFSRGAQLLLRTRIQQEKYILAELTGQQLGMEEMKKLMDSRIVRPVSPQ